MERLGQLWKEGYLITEYNLGDKKIKLLDSQIEFINSKDKFVLEVGGYGSGKTLALAIKLILMSLCFPDNNILLGRKHLGLIEKGLWPDIQKLMNPNWYHYRVKDGIVRFFNGSDILFYGLDALQSGGLADIKKAQQKIKGLNLGAFFIDQLEEVDYGTFDALRGRLRRKNVPWLQANMTSNPATYWAYDFFKANPQKGTKLIQSSMMENEANLPADYLEDQLNHDKRYVDRYVRGIWTPSVLTDKLVFAEEYILKFKPKKFHKEEGCEIYRDYNNCKYQIGVDPSEGVVDPSSISVVSEYGEKVAKFNGKIPIFALGGKVKFLYEKYHKPLIIPEVNAAGQALLLQIRDLNIFKRTVYDEKYDKQQEKLGWKTSYQTKQALISNFQELLRQDFPKIWDEGTINELQAFEWTDVAKQKGAGASPTFHDDDVMSTMLAYWGMSPDKIKKKRILQEYRRSLRKHKMFQYI